MIAIRLKKRPHGRLVGLIRMMLLLIFPTAIVRGIVNLLGYEIERGARIGFSFLLVDNVQMASSARIGHINLVKGHYLLRLGEKAALGHMNLISGTYAEGDQQVVLSLANGAKITALHTVDMTRSIYIGRHSVIAGHGSQLWTHGYVHDVEGPGRYRVDGTIEIGDNVYIGSGSIISAGVRLVQGVAVGTGTAVAKSLLEPGYYVSSPLRVLPRPDDPETRPDLERVPSRSGDVVYCRRRSAPK